MKFFWPAILLVMCSVSAAQNNHNQCSKFNGVALQFALVQTNMQAPLNLEQLQSSLGTGKLESTSVITEYTWIDKKDRILFVKVINGDIVAKFLRGKGDGSPISKKMEQIYKELKTATSVWKIDGIQKQLGTGHIKRNKLQNYSWSCGMGLLEVAVGQNSNITAATIGYKTYQNESTIEAQFSFVHPEWDIKTNDLSQTYRVWKRTF
jgi:hypothetical protein